jgi:tetratricopeptide (TPR) repeat protein
MQSCPRRATRSWVTAVAPFAVRVARSAAVVLAFAGTAHAGETSNDAAYRAAIEEAISAFESSDLAAARAAFERAHALSPNARTFRGIGLTAFRQGDYLAASANFRSALDDSRKPLSAEQRAEAARLLARADGLIGHVRVTVTPPDASIRFDGRVVQAGSSFDVPSGPHVARADLAGYQPIERQIDVAPGVPTTVKLELGAMTTAPPASSTGVPASRPETSASSATSSTSSPRLWTWVALGAAPVFAGAGLAIWLSGLSDSNRIKGMRSLDQAARDQAAERAGLPEKATWATVSYVAGGVALGTAVVLYFVEGGQKKTQPKVSFALTGTGAYAVGTF